MKSKSIYLFVSILLCITSEASAVSFVHDFSIRTFARTSFDGGYDYSLNEIPESMSWLQDEYVEFSGKISIDHSGNQYEDSSYWRYFEIGSWQLKMDNVDFILSGAGRLMYNSGQTEGNRGYYYISLQTDQNSDADLGRIGTSPVDTDLPLFDFNLLGELDNIMDDGRDLGEVNIDIEGNGLGVGWDIPVFSSYYMSISASCTAVEPVPEPATMLLFGIGLAGIVCAKTRHKN